MSSTNCYHESEEEDRQLLEFQKIDGITQRVKERAEIIRLNHHGWSVAVIGFASARGNREVSTEVTSYSQNKSSSLV
ncbi:hypothetical protein ACLFKQ_03965 [Myxosarcina sp. GI1(2024)]